MNIQTAKERILIIKETITLEDARSLAVKKRMAAFGTLNQMTSLFSAPKDDDFEEIYTEQRYEPFWHVSAHARYVFDRSSEYQVPVSEPTVKQVTLHDHIYDIQNGKSFTLPLTEHCTLEESISVCIDAVNGKEQSFLKPYTSLESSLAKQTLESSVSPKSIIVPPATRVSGIVRETLAKLIKGIQADAISEEQVIVDVIDLYYRPVYAFEYRWVSKDKKGIVQIDACTSAVTTGTRTFSEFIGKKIDTNFLFDVGADAAGMFIPGGSIAVKVAKKYIDSKTK